MKTEELGKNYPKTLVSFLTKLNSNPIKFCTESVKNLTSMPNFKVSTINSHDFLQILNVFL